MNQNEIQSIDRVLFYSKQILKYKKFISELRQALITAITLPAVEGRDLLQLMVNSAGRRIEECEDHCKIFLRATLNGKDFGHDKYNHFTGEELKQGYVLLREQNVQLEKPIDFITHVLFIKDVKKVKRGTLMEYSNAINVIEIRQKRPRTESS